MSTMIAFDFNPDDVSVVIPPGTDLAPHQDGTIEAMLPVTSAAVERPESMDGRIVARLAGSGTIDLILALDVAEQLGMALIRAAAMPARHSADPSAN
jgi:hypothetical protein